jgi:hypothetical protein
MPEVQALAASSFSSAPSPWLNPLQAAAYLGLSTGTLSVWRCVDGQNARRDISPKGPPYSLAGTQIRYNIVDLDVAHLRRLLPIGAQQTGAGSISEGGRSLGRAVHRGAHPPLSTVGLLYRAGLSDARVCRSAMYLDN